MCIEIFTIYIQKMPQSHKCKCDTVWGFGYLNTGDSLCFFAHPRLHQCTSVHWPITCGNNPVAVLTDRLSERLRPEARESGVLHHSLLWHTTRGTRALLRDEVFSYSRKCELLDLLFLFTLLCDCSHVLPCAFSFCLHIFLFPIFILLLYSSTTLSW